jgi:hypothetical protein
MAINGEQTALINSVLQQLDAGKVPDDVINRRRKSRVKLRLSISALLLVAQPAPVQIYTRNLSVSGLGFVSRRFFQAQDQLAIPFNYPGMKPRLILARIMFCRYLKGGLYEVGVEFLDSVTDEAAHRIPRHWLPSTNPSKPRPQPAGK